MNKWHYFNSIHLLFIDFFCHKYCGTAAEVPECSDKLIKNSTVQDLK